MKKNLAKKVTLSILAGAVLMSSSVVWAATASVADGTWTGIVVNSSGTATSANTSVDSTGAIAIGSGASTNRMYSIAIGSNASTNGAYGTAVGRSAKTDGAQASAFGYSAQADAGEATALGAGAKASYFGSVALGSGSVADEQDVVSVGSGENGPFHQYRKIVNVKDGVEDHDAATVGQMNTKLALKADLIYVNDGLANKADKATTLAGYGITDAYTKSEVDAKFANAATGGTVDLSAYAKQTDLTNLNDEVVKTNEELQKTNSNVSKINEELVKTNDHFNKELRNTNTQVVANAENIANIQNATIDLNQRLYKTNAKINKVGAGAAALAALHPLDYDPDDKLTFSAGMGNYAGENAAALGAFYRPNEKFMVSLGGTMGNGENMVNLGLSIGLDKPNGFAKLSKRELIQKVNVMEAKYEQVEAENEAMKAEIAEMKTMLQELLAKK